MHRPSTGAVKCNVIVPVFVDATTSFCSGIRHAVGNNGTTFYRRVLRVGIAKKKKKEEGTWKIEEREISKRGKVDRADIQGGCSMKCREMWVKMAEISIWLRISRGK